MKKDNVMIPPLYSRQ